MLYVLTKERSKIVKKSFQIIFSIYFFIFICMYRFVYVYVCEHKRVRKYFVCVFAFRCIFAYIYILYIYYKNIFNKYIYGICMIFFCQFKT